MKIATLALAALLLAGPPMATAALAQTPAPARAPQPGYMVVQGEHPETQTAWQSLTVVCPTGYKAFGNGFSAIVRDAPKPGVAAATYHEEGLNQIRSYPDGAGTGWRVEGVPAEAGRAGLSWRLAERVVCVRIGV
ncbi:MAG TPA: hypothetical protein VHZ26_09025 [Caulobacteraceae bacterium]|jgi:hypothetical protein|nr:hypothetical protein [Caulobacteraceae bacterium]